MKHEYSEGTAFYLVTIWGFPIYFAAADCKLPYPLIPFPLTMLSNHSGDDPTSICNVESVQMDSLYPLVHLHVTCYFFLHC